MAFFPSHVHPTGSDLTTHFLEFILSNLTQLPNYLPLSPPPSGRLACPATAYCKPVLVPDLMQAVHLQIGYRAKDGVEGDEPGPSGQASNKSPVKE